MEWEPGGVSLKRGPQISISITWELFRNADSQVTQAPPPMPSQQGTLGVELAKWVLTSLLGNVNLKFENPCGEQAPS